MAKRSEKRSSEFRSIDSDMGDRVFMSEISDPKASMRSSSEFNDSGSEPISSVPSPESGDPRDRGISGKMSGVEDLSKNQSNIGSSW